MIPVSSNTNLVAKPVTLLHADGSTETVYLMTMPVNSEKKLGDKVREHAIMWYFLIGTVAIGISIFISMKQLKK